MIGPELMNFSASQEGAEMTIDAFGRLAGVAKGSEMSPQVSYKAKTKPLRVALLECAKRRIRTTMIALVLAGLFPNGLRNGLEI